MESKLKKTADQLSSSEAEAKRLQASLSAAETEARGAVQRADTATQQLNKLNSLQIDTERRSAEVEKAASQLKEREVELHRREEATKRANEGLEKKVAALKTGKETLQTKADVAEARAQQAEAGTVAAEKARVKAEKERNRLQKKLDDLAAKSSTADKPVAAPPQTPATEPAAVQKAKPSNEKTSAALVAVRAELATQRLHKFIAMVVSAVLLLILLAKAGSDILASASGSRRKV